MSPVNNLVACARAEMDFWADAMRKAERAKDDTNRAFWIERAKKLEAKARLYTEAALEYVELRKENGQHLPTPSESTAIALLHSEREKVGYAIQHCQPRQSYSSGSPSFG